MCGIIYLIEHKFYLSERDFYVMLPTNKLETEKIVCCSISKNGDDDEDDSYSCSSRPLNFFSIIDTNEETAAQVRALGKVAHTYVCDLTSKDDIYRVGAKVQREVGPVDILVNNAGILSGRKLLNLKDEDIERTMKINTLAHFWVISKVFQYLMLFYYQ